MDGMDGWLSYTAVTPRASLQSDAIIHENIYIHTYGNVYVYILLNEQAFQCTSKLSWDSKLPIFALMLLPMLFPT